MKIAHPEAAFREAAEEACRSIGTMVEKWVCAPRGCWPGRGGEGVPTAGLWAASLPSRHLVLVLSRAGTVICSRGCCEKGRR